MTRTTLTIIILLSTSLGALLGYQAFKCGTAIAIHQVQQSRLIEVAP